MAVAEANETELYAALAGFLTPILGWIRAKDSYHVIEATTTAIAKIDTLPRVSKNSLKIVMEARQRLSAFVSKISVKSKPIDVLAAFLPIASLLNERISKVCTDANVRKKYGELARLSMNEFVSMKAA